MKFLFFLFSFFGIAAFGVTCVAPMLQDCVEGHLEAKVKDVLEQPKFSKKYSIANVKMDHFHAKQLTIQPKVFVGRLDETKIKKEIVDAIDPILGVNVQDALFVLNIAERGKAPKDKMAEIPIVREAPPNETPNLAIIKEPVSFTIDWNAEKKELLLDGRQTNQRAGNELIKFFKEAKKDPKTKSSIKSDRNKVANSKYLQRTLRDIRLLIINSHDDLNIEFRDVIKTNDGLINGYLKYKGTTETLDVYDALTRNMQNLESDDFEVHNELVFYPDVSIRKDARKEKITLTGCVKSRADRGMLGSNASRDVTNNFSTDNKLTTHERCLEISWLDDSSQILIAKYMGNVSDGEIIYRNNRLHSLSGVSHDSNYVEEVKLAYPEIAKKLIYLEAPLKQIELVEPEPARPETLADQLKDHKIYFESGRSVVDPRYKAQLDDIANKIKFSKDKTSQIAIGGYADTSGHASHNKTLSLKRARAVMSQLVRRGIGAKRLEVEFLGAEEADNEDTKAESRRVEIKVRKK